MGDSVKFIFKTLIKVPIIIVTSFLIFNLFAFTVTYFRMTGASYAVMQVGLNNNYLPQQELEELTNYVGGFRNERVKNIRIMGYNEATSQWVTLSEDGIINNGTIVEAANSRKQYGQVVGVGLEYTYVWVWPLTPKEQTTRNIGVSGISNTGVTMKDERELETAREARKIGTTTNLFFKIPGLRYYADLD